MAFIFWCPDCKAHVQLEEDGRNDVPDEEPGVRLNIIHIFGHCVRCGRSGILEGFQTGMNASDFEPRTQVYPPVVQRRVDCTLPPKVDESYLEALRCSSSEAWIATAVMVRRTLEAIGKDFDPKAKRLFDGLRTMKEQGVISEELWRWGDELRFLGNIGAHPTDDVVSKQDAIEAIEFLNAIVETLYHLRPKFQAMQARRTAKAAKTQKGSGDSQGSEGES